MKAFIALSVAGAAVSLTPASAQPVLPTLIPHQAPEVRMRADVQSRITRHFARIDSDGDGFVTQAEAGTARARLGEKMRQRAAKRAERRDPARQFARLDVNGDGQITVAEVQSLRAARIAKQAAGPAAAGGGRMFARLDANRDGVVTRAEFNAVPRRDHAGMHPMRMDRGLSGRMFGQADVNRDGRVSLAEAQQIALQHFDRLDLNRDGKVTREERQQARAQRRS